MKEVILQIETELKNRFKDEPTGHDWEHIRRVRDMAMHIQSLEGGDPFVIELGALLHDISDHKFNGGILNAGGEKAREWLEQLKVDEKIVLQVSALVDQVSFKGAGVKTGKLNLETQIVQDADRLDALGAVGIARAFAFGGNRNQLIHSDSIKIVEHDSFESYVNAKTTSINHFYEKLLLLKNRINTKTAKKIAEDRHLFMEQFLQKFLTDWNLNT